MATVSYSDYCESRQRKSTATSKDFKVGYFNSLKDDGDETIVRFAYTDTKDFKFNTVHVIEVDGKFKRVACLRTPTESADKCPLCASGNKYKSKMYVKLLEYTKDEEGKVVANAKVWERPAEFNKKIIAAFNMAKEIGTYSPSSNICDVVFKIKRNGAKKSLDTEYEVIPANPSIFKEELYVKNFDAFNDLDLAHHSYTEKTAEEMKEYLTSGAFPSKNTLNEDTKVDTTRSVNTSAPKEDFGYTLKDTMTAPTSAPSPRRFEF